MKLALLATLYSCAMTISLLVDYLKSEYQILGQTVVMAEIPHMICDIVVIGWSLSAFRKTISKLLKQ